MKKLFLLLASGSIVLSASAQQLSSSTMVNREAVRTSGYTEFMPGNVQEVKNTLKHSFKTTAGPTERWYNYGNYFDTTVSITGSTSLALPYLWNDTLSKDAYGDGSGGTVYQHNRTVSVGSVFHPQFSGLNDPALYPGDMYITAANSYKIDSIIIFGYYGRNPAKQYPHDTLRIAMMSGGADFQVSYFDDATTRGNYGLGATDSLFFALLPYDSVKNTTTGITRRAFDVMMDTSTINDTTASGIWAHTIAVPGGGFTVPAGDIAGISYSFKSGDASFRAHDTVFNNGVYKYNMFRPYVIYSGTSTSIVYPPYTPGNWNSGEFKTLPNFRNGWGDVYIPTWAWGVGGASTNQIPYIAMKVSCPTCASTGGVNPVTEATAEVVVYPNPADENVNIAYNFHNSANGSITLSNAIGQTVATQKLVKATAGTFTVNTATLPAGIYIYSVIANGSRSTGRVVVAH